MTVLLDPKSALNGPGPTASLDANGQNGFMMNSLTWGNSSRFTAPRMIAVLIEAPRAATRYLENPQEYVRTLKSLIEDRPTNITGIQFGITNEYTETTEGNSGRVRETITNSTRERSVPSIIWPETLGRAISHFWEFSSRTLQMDPDTGVPLVATYASRLNDANPLPLSEENVGFTVLFYEPNLSLDGVVRSVLVRNMQPKSIGDVQLTRNVGEALEAPTVEIEFTSKEEYGDMVDKLALDHLTSLNRLGLSPDSLPTYVEGITPDVQAADNGAASLLDSNS